MNVTRVFRSMLAIQDRAVGALRKLSTGVNVAFIGLGNMGNPMALNVAKGGFNVHVFDKCEKRTKQLMAQATGDLRGHVIPQSSLHRLMECCPSVVITMLPSSPQVIEVYGQQSLSNGLIGMAKEKTFFIDCTTGDPQVARTVSDYAISRKCTFIDAPVSGGIPAARKANLTFMVGGADDVIECATPILKRMGNCVFHCGPVGAGLAAKICNNMLLAISMIGTSEAMELGMRLGLDPRILAEVINKSSGRCWSSEVYNPVPGIVQNVPSSSNYTGGFGTAMMVKDLGLAQNASTATLSATPMGSLAHQVYRMLCQHGYGDKDFSCIYQFLTEQNGPKDF